MEQNPFLRKERREKRETSTRTKEERRRDTSTGTPAGTRRSQQIIRNPFPEERKKREEGDKHRNPSRNQEEPANHDGTEPLS